MYFWVSCGKDLSEERAHLHDLDHGWLVYLTPLQADTDMNQQVKSIFLVVLQLSFNIWLLEVLQ